MKSHRAMIPAAAVAGLFLLSAPAALDAQAYRYGAGWRAGGTYITELNADRTGPSPEALEPGLGFVVGIQLERWYGRSALFGLRYQLGYQQPRIQWTPGERKIDVVEGDVSLIARPTTEGPVVPYVTLGAGGIWYDLGTGPDTFFPSGDAFHDGTGRVLPMITFGGGADVPSPFRWESAPVRIRLEVADHMTFGSPLKRASDRTRHGAVHHVRFTIGAYSALDLIR